MDVNTSFDQIAQLLNEKNYTSFGSVQELQHLASEGNTIFTVIDKLGNRFTAEVYHNSETGDLRPPLSQQIPYLIGLTLPVLIEIVIEMNLHDILSICRTNTHLNVNICENDTFWKEKFIHDFGLEDIKEEMIVEEMIVEEKPITTPGYWKERYKNFGKVWSFGSNYNGQLGLPSVSHLSNLSIPTLITSVPIKQISAGHDHTLMLDTLGRVWSFGENYVGQLGLGLSYYVDRNIPTLITGAFDGVMIKAISAGLRHSLLLDVDGRVWSFGSNEFGQLGLGDSGRGKRRNKPNLLQIEGGIPIKSISAGMSHSLLLDTTGKVWAFGDNSDGQLGLGFFSSWGNNINKPMLVQLESGILIESISAGRNSLILDTLGRVWSFGDNKHGRLGLGSSGFGNRRNRPTLITGIPTIKAISLKSDHSLLLDISGGVWSFGNNEFGQLGLGDHGGGTSRNKPVAITGVPPIPSVIAVSAGSDHSLLLDTDGEIWSFGKNSSGQLGLGNQGIGTNINMRSIPTKIYFSMSVKIRAISAGDRHSLIKS